MVAPKHNSTFSFTQKSLDDIPPAPLGMRTVYKDNQVKGLILRVTDKGQKSFVVYKKVHGRPLKVTLGPYPTMKIGEARGQAGETLAAFQKGKNPNVEKKKIRQEITLGELFNDYLERHSKAFKKSWAYDEREIPKHLGHWFNRRLSSLSAPEVQELHFQQKENHGLYQANRTLERIRGM